MHSRFCTEKTFYALQGYSCADLYTKGLTESGIYYLQIQSSHFWFLKVFCDMQIAQGGWTVRSRLKCTESQKEAN